MSPSWTKVRFTPVMGGVLLALGLVNCFLGVWLLMLGEFNFSLVIGFFFIPFGAWQLNKTYFWLDRDPEGQATISGPNRNGPLGKGCTAATGERFVAEGGLIVRVAADGSRTPAPVRRWMAHSGDWRTLAAELESEPSREPTTPEDGAS